MKNEMQDTTTFVVSYLVVMLLTYVWRPLFTSIAINLASNNVANSFEQGFAEGYAIGQNCAIAAMLFLIINYVLLALIAIWRGKFIKKDFLVFIVVLAGIIDVGVNFAYLIPTILNIIVITVGALCAEKKVE